MLRSAVLGTAIALVAAGGASAEVVARGVQDGLLALNAKGTPSVAFVRGSSVYVATRSSSGRWNTAKAAAVSPGSTVTAFATGAAGPVVLVQSADARTLLLVRRRSVGWQTIPIVRRLPAVVKVGLPGLALDARGAPHVGYTRWNGATLNSQLLLATVNPKGLVRTIRITTEGFPQSLVPPPAAAVMVGNQVHVIESHGYRDVLTTLEWLPKGRSWLGLGLDAGLGDWPIGPVFAGVTAAGTLYAASTQSVAYYDSAPVTLVVRRTNPTARVVFDRALTTGLVLPPSGPEVVANEWVGPSELGSAPNRYVWAGTIVHGARKVELDGWLAGFALTPGGGRDLLLGGSTGLRWFRSPRSLTTRVTVNERSAEGGTATLTGRVRGISRGTVTLYRESPGGRRRAIGRTAVSGGSFTFRAAVGTATVRAVWVDPQTKIPYAALLRPDVSP